MELYLVYISDDDDYGASFTGNYRYASVKIIGIFDDKETAKEISEKCNGEIHIMNLNDYNSEIECKNAYTGAYTDYVNCNKCENCSNAIERIYGERIASFPLEDTSGDW